MWAGIVVWQERRCRGSGRRGLGEFLGQFCGLWGATIPVQRSNNFLMRCGVGTGCGSTGKGDTCERLGGVRQGQKWGVRAIGKQGTAARSGSVFVAGRKRTGD